MSDEDGPLLCFGILRSPSQPGATRTSFRMAGRGASLPDLTPVAAEAGAAEGDPRLVYTWAGPPHNTRIGVCSYLPSGGGAPRLVAEIGILPSPMCRLGVWDIGTGALLRALPCPQGSTTVVSLVTYQRSSDGRPRIAAGSDGGGLCIWDGDEFQLLHTLGDNLDGYPIDHLAVYEEPTSGRTRLVTG
jgi:hypothetical protein